MLCVLGIGNKLLGDDGAGVHVVEELNRQKLPSGVTVIDAGVAILRMLPIVAKADALIVVDAIRGGGPPGTIYTYEQRVLPQGRFRSVHDVTVLDLLAQISLIGHQPRVEYYGIEPKEIGYSLRLSTEVSAQVPVLADIIRRRIASINATAEA